MIELLSPALPGITLPYFGAKQHTGRKTTGKNMPGTFYDTLKSDVIMLST
jgi:hypothetical protein